MFYELKILVGGQVLYVVELPGHKVIHADDLIASSYEKIA
jgi:hypothetical protein